jgi:hypothetical protein
MRQFVQTVVEVAQSRRRRAPCGSGRPSARSVVADPQLHDMPTVRRWAIRVAHRTYSVPARLMGHTVGT